MAFNSIETAHINELMIRFQNGDKSAFEELCASYYEGYYRFMLRHTSREHLAKDLTQEVFLKLALKDFSGVEFTNASAYIYRMLRSSYRDYYRSAKATKEVDIFIADGAYEDNYYDLAINELTAGLSERELAIFNLRYIEGYSVNEVAEMLEVSYGTVKKYSDTIRKKIMINDNTWLIFLMLLMAMSQIRI